MSVPCPCGGGLVIEMSWQQLIGVDAYYCPHEDDVLLSEEVERIS